MEDIERPAFGSLLRHLRRAAGMSQEELAERARISSESIGALERGTRRSPYRQTIALIAAALDLSAEDRAKLEDAAGRPRRLRSIPLTEPVDETAAALNNLPAEVSSFVGREDAVAEVTEYVDTHRLVTLVGSGGVGKTRLALRVAANQRERWPDGVWLAELAPLAQPALVQGTIAQALGVQTSPQRPLLDSIVASLRDKRLLLVIDNCEHVIDAAAQAALAILRGCPHVKILATSRQPLGVGGERSYRVASLTHPSEGDVTAVEASRHSAVRLFAQRARDAGGDFVLADSNARSVAEICRRLDGIPLAIELAATHVKVCTPRQIAQMLDERFAVLGGGDRTALPRLQTMRATIDWSFTHLTEPEKTLARRLGIFAGGWTLDAAEAVCSLDPLREPQILGLLASLVDKSLVTVTFWHEEVRYRLLESIRAYALEQLAAAGERELLARRHAEWAADYGEWVTEWQFSPPSEDGRLVRWTPDVYELDNRPEALEWALGPTGDVMLAARIAGSSNWTTSEADERRLTERLLQQVRDGDRSDVEARLWLTLSDATRGERSFEAARRAVAIFERLGQRGHWLASSLDYLQEGCLATGRYAEALAASDKQFELLVELKQSSTRRAVALHQRADILLNLGRYEEARRCVGQASTLGNPSYFELPAATILAELACREGYPARAAQLADEAAATRPRSEWRALFSVPRRAMSINRSNAAAYRLMLADVEGARLAALDSLELERGARRWSPLTTQIQHLAAVAAMSGDAELAARLKGYVDAWYAAEHVTRSATDAKSYHILVAALAERLDEATIERLAGEGALLDEYRAVEMAVE
jgi:predicted ATPase/DNA-binding XRE family transcriptional regulator